jgi:hypothetical protein
MKPDAAQRGAQARMADARRWIWNWALAEREKHYWETGEIIAAIGTFTPSHGAVT